MNMSQDTYKQTAAVYKQLGKQYISDTKKVVPVERTEFIAQTPKHGRVLDIGCAGGRDTKVFVRAGLEVHGIDVVDIFLREAKQYVPKATFKKMDVRTLKYPPQYFDAIWAQAVLLHIEKKDIVRVLRNLRRVLKPGGLLHIRVKWGRDAMNVREKISQHKERHFTLFYKNELERLVKKVGFRIVKSQFTEDELHRKDVRWVTLWARK